MSAIMEREGLVLSLVTGRQPVDIEELVRWAILQTGRLPWRNPSDNDLALDHGWNCVPKATRALYQPSGGVLLSRAINPDAFRVVEAVKALDPATAAQVIACARQGIRPNALIGVEPKLVTKIVSWRKAKRKKKNRKGNRLPVTVAEWEPCEPQAICAARGAYTRWHRALSVLAARLKDELTDWRITGFSASAVPWETAPKIVVDLAKTPVTLPHATVE